MKELFSDYEIESILQESKKLRLSPGFRGGATAVLTGEDRQ